MFKTMNPNIYFVVCSIFFAILSNYVCHCQGPVEHDGFCNETLLCNTDNWLNCTSGKCDCEKDTYWDNDTLICRAIIGSRCEEVGTPKRSCIINGTCWKASPSEDGKCVCEEGYIPTPSNEQCLVEHKRSCGSDQDCNKYSFLKCRDNLCTCDEENKIWNPVIKSCACKVGKFCGNQTGLEICVDNAIMDSTTKICSCCPDYQETPSGECKLNYQQPCGMDLQCHPKFKCHAYNESSTGTVCRCDPSTEEYDAQLDLCRIKAGTSCENNKNCVKHSYCSEITNLCICSAEYEESTSGHCVAGHGAYCRNDEMICNSNLNLECNSQTWKCDCINGYHNFDSPKCLALPGTTCAADEDCYEFSGCLNNTDNSGKMCVCKSGYSITPQNICALDHGQPCTMKSMCNEYNFLSCDVQTQKCNCSHSLGMTYSTGTKACQAKAEQVCYFEEIEDRKLECIPNADCVRDTTNPISSRGSCKCVSGFYPNDNGFCDTNAPATASLGVKSSILLTLTSIILYTFIA